MALPEMCNDAPMEYRYSVGKRVGDSLVGVTWALGSAFAIGTSIFILVDPASVGFGSAGPLVGRFVLVFCIGVAMAYMALVYARRVFGDRLIVADDGLVCREGSRTRTRTTTIPWSSVTSFTVLTSGPPAHWRAVYATLRTGQRVRLPCTARSGRAGAAAAAAIAEALTAKLRDHS
jgi:hypothetical protein